jgi:hypothetical protein
MRDFLLVSSAMRRIGAFLPRAIADNKSIHCQAIFSGKKFREEIVIVKLQFETAPYSFLPDNGRSKIIPFVHTLREMDSGPFGWT